ncbi:MAG: M14 family metallocarboxypeptidase [Kangiellaceae bacterium]|nr:M14 family metallocarboxypeptidase [Kangiellaceae bacterium]
MTASNQSNGLDQQKKKWGSDERATWNGEQITKRSYIKEVVSKLSKLVDHFNVQQYGALSYDEAKFPLYVIKTKQWDSAKPVVLITGGVHGYETSGVHGALEFARIQSKALVGLNNELFEKYFNLVIAPCVSPWGYETINRWNPNTVDPNRSFYQESPAEESANLMNMVTSIDGNILVHFDLHETTDTDNTVFRPALAARDASTHDNWNIPDGFYLVGNSENPADAFQTAIIKSVEKITHIAPPDKDGKIIGKTITQKGVINYQIKELYLCAGMTDCDFTTTTEVYPDSHKVTDQDCVDAQVAAIVGGLDYLLAKEFN